MKTRALITAAIVAVGGGLVAQSAEAQATIWSRERAPMGWIGVSVDLQTSNVTGSVRTRVVVLDVKEGSPAAAAGLRVGDVILAINDVGRLEDLGDVRRGLTVSPGGQVDMVIDRQGARRRVALIAVEPPEQFDQTVRVTLDFSPDSLIEAVVREMESFRLQITGGGRNSGVAVVEVGGRSEAEGRSQARLFSPGIRTLEPDETDGMRFRFSTTGGVYEDFVTPEVRFPFEFFVFQGEGHDSLRNEVDRLNAEIRSVNAQRMTRLRLVAPDGDPQQGSLAARELRQLSTEMQALSDRSGKLRRALEEAARHGAGGHTAPSPTPLLARAAAEAPVVRRAGGFSPLTPYLVGQNWAAGAQVADLQPEMASYFGVPGGVLVVDAPEGSMAHVAGIRPGDVMVRVGARSVRSVQDLRIALTEASASRSIPVQLVRKGDTLRVDLRR